MNPAPDPDIDPAGQHRLVGWALVGLGGFCGLVSASITVFEVDMAFIDGPTMLLMSGIMAGLGYWQVRLGDEYDE